MHQSQYLTHLGYTLVASGALAFIAAIIAAPILR